MKRKLLVIFFFLTFSGNLLAQNPLVKQWDYRFGGTHDDWLTCFQQTNDGGYILGGYTWSGIGGDKSQGNWGQADYWIVKIDSLGIKQWDKDFGGTSHDELHSLQKTTDGGYILGGYSYSGIGGDKTQANWDTSLMSADYWIVKIDSLGVKQWDKDFGGKEGDYLYSLQQTADKGFILGGYSQSKISGDKTQPNWDTICTFGCTVDYWIIKIDSLGNKQWDKVFGGTNSDILLSCQLTTDGGYIFGGYSFSDSSGDKSQSTYDTCASCNYNNGDYWIIRIDSLGNKQWDKDYGGVNSEYFSDIQKTADGGFILGGFSRSGIGGVKTQNTWGTYDFWIVKIDSLGNMQWDKDYGASSYEESLKIFLTSDGGYLFSGDSYSPISGDKTENNLANEQTWFVKTDSLGIIQWDKTLHTNALAYDDESGMAIQSVDGCYSIANCTPGGIGGDKTQPNWDTIPSSSKDYWIIKFCDSTATTSINQISNSQFPISIYPNPTNSKLNLILNQNENIVITNLLGEIVLQRNATGKVELDISFLSSGIYFIKAGSEVRKFVKE